MTKKLLLLNLIMFVLLIFFFAETIHYRQKLTDVLINKNANGAQAQPCQYELKYFDFHYRKETDSPSIIMLGNSLIRSAPWDSLLNRKDVINRGISGDKMQCICERLTYLRGTSAKICFIEGGLNDLPGQSVDTLFKYYTQIVTFWKNEHVIPVIDLVLYISPKAGQKFPSRKDYKAINKVVKDLNNKLIEFANKNDIDLIDLNKSLCDEKNLFLKNEYTIDGVHLTEPGYQVWAKEIQQILAKHKI